MLVKERGRWAVFPRTRGVFFRGSLRLPFEMESCSQATTKDLIKLEIVLCALNPVWLTDHPFFPEKGELDYLGACFCNIY